MCDDFYMWDLFNLVLVLIVRDLWICNEDDEVKFLIIDYVFFVGGLGGNFYVWM